MPDPQIQCDICHDSFTIDRFRFLMGCGHGFCHKCLCKIPKRRYGTICPACRSETSLEPRQIYMTFAERTEPRRLIVAGGPEELSTDRFAASLGRAVQKIKKEARTADATSRSLLDAAQTFEKRLRPVFAALELERVEKAAILEENAILKSRLKRTESMHSDVVNLKKQLRIKNATMQAAKTLLAEATAQARDERAESVRLDQLVNKLRKALDRKKAELQTAEVSQQDKDDQIYVLKTKLRVLTKQGKPHKPTQDLDDSLQIEQPPKNIDRRPVRKGQPVKKTA